KIVMEKGASASYMSSLKSGRYDFICGPITVTKPRTKVFLFTEPYLWTERAFLTQEDGPVLSKEDLKGKTIAVQKSTPSHKWVLENADRLGMKPMVFGGSSDAAQAVAQGRADAYLADKTAVQYLAKKIPGLRVGWIIPGTRS